MRGWHIQSERYDNHREKTISIGTNTFAAPVRVTSRAIHLTSSVLPHSASREPTALVVQNPMVFLDLL